MNNTQELIRRLNQTDKKLSKSHRKIAECLLTHPDKAVFMTAAELGKYAGVSESTVVRFAATLGYDGYPQLRKDLREIIRHRLTVSQRFEMTGDLDHLQMLNRVFKADMQNIRTTLDEIDMKAFGEAVDSITNADRIYIMGLRSSAPIAEFFAHYLNFILPNVQVVTSGISDVFEQLSTITDRDLLIGISFPRYTARSVEAMEFACRRGAAIIAITDGPMSPLYDAANIRLIAASEMSSFVDSFAAPLSLINALIIAIGQRKRTEVQTYFRRMEETWNKYNVYISKGDEQ